MISKNPTGRPKKIAGQRPPSAGGGWSSEAPRWSSEAESPAPERAPAPQPAWPDESHPARAAKTPHEPRPRLLVALVVAIVLLVAAALAEAAYLWGPFGEDPVVSAERPVVTDEVTVATAVDTAARAAVDIVSRDYRTYDEQVGAATAQMTEAFAEEYRQVTSDIKADFVEAETVITAEIAYQGVMTASDEQVRALIFLDQLTEKAGEPGALTPYRVLVTVKATEAGWLVSDVETK